jgi:hypothetical protein
VVEAPNLAIRPCRLLDMAAAPVDTRVSPLESPDKYLKNGTLPKDPLPKEASPKETFPKGK